MHIFRKPFTSIGSAAALALGLAACASPDLTISRLDVTPSTVEVGDEVDITSTIANQGRGAARVPDAPGSDVSTSADIQLFANRTERLGAAYLTGWGPSRDLVAGDSETTTYRAATPENFNPGRYFVCGDVDLADHVRESDETNNRTCVMITMVEPTRPDLVVSGVKFGAASGVSRRFYATITNQGNDTAENFRVDAYMLTPSYWPLLVTNCRLTEMDRAAGGASCGSPFVERLEPGDTTSVAAWITFPADRTSGASETIRLMADGCHAPTEPTPLPAWCRTRELDETNNALDASITIP